MFNTKFQTALAISKMTIAGGIVFVSSALGTYAQADGLPDFAILVENEGKAVVNIAVKSAVRPAALNGQPDLQQIPEQYRKFFERQQDPRRGPRSGSGVGSGFIVSDDRYILT